MQQGRWAGPPAAEAFLLLEVGLWVHREGRVHRGHQEATLYRVVQRLEDLHRGDLSVALQEDLWGDRHQVPLHREDHGEGHQEGL